MGAWVFRRTVAGVDEYWTGEMDYGEPVVSVHRCEALGFTGRSPEDGYSAAMQTAQTHAALRDSEEWKVVRR